MPEEKSLRDQIIDAVIEYGRACRMMERESSNQKEIRKWRAAAEAKRLEITTMVDALRAGVIG